MTQRRMSLEEYNKIKSEKKSKYNSKKTEYDGFIYDSKSEADYAKQLNFFKHAHDLDKRVISIERQVPYNVYVGKSGVFVCTYFADFRVKYADGRVEVVDVKSDYTSKLPVYRLKKKLVEAFHGIIIKEVIMNKKDEITKISTKKGIKKTKKN